MWYVKSVIMTGFRKFSNWLFAKDDIITLDIECCGKACPKCGVCDHCYIHDEEFCNFVLKSIEETEKLRYGNKDHPIY